MSFSDDLPYTWDVTVLEVLPRARQKLDVKIYQGAVGGSWKLHTLGNGPQRPRTENDKDRGPGLIC